MQQGASKQPNAAALSMQPNAAYVRCSRSKPEGYPDKLLAGAAVRLTPTGRGEKACMTKLGDKLAGRFIVFDGPDGSGKSTQLVLLREYLTGQGVEVTVVRDPGGTPIGQRIRSILLDKAHGEMTVECELMLYMASRAQLVAQVVRPALESGRCVLGDRYISATVAYQGAGGVSAEAIRQAGMIAVGPTWPDLTIILDLPVETGLSRVSSRSRRTSEEFGRHDRMESRDIAFHEAVRSLFLDQAAEQAEKFAVVDAEGSIEEVHQRLRDLLENRRFE